MVRNQGKKRAKEKRKMHRRKEKEKARNFGVITTDNKGNKRISLE